MTAPRSRRMKVRWPRRVACGHYTLTGQVIIRRDGRGPASRARSFGASPAVLVRAQRQHLTLGQLALLTSLLR
jgi:hypothetical protein